MALDATPAGVDADSYLTVADADTLAGKIGLPNWTGLTEGQKEEALRRSALEIDAHRFHSPDPYVEGQARCFPREVDEGVIPKRVEWAALFQAEWLATSGESDRKQWEGAKAAPLKDARVGSPLCPNALLQLGKLISRTGSYA